MNKFAYTAVLSLMLASCATENEVHTSATPKQLTVPQQADRWTYISLTNHKIVGYSELGNPQGDAEFAKRTDWDIALCNGRIRTNSGLSGQGNGGIAPANGAFDTDNPLAPTIYKTDDSTSVDRWQHTP